MRAGRFHAAGGSLFYGVRPETLKLGWSSTTTNGEEIKILIESLRRGQYRPDGEDRLVERRVARACGRSAVATRFAHAANPLRLRHDACRERSEPELVAELAKFVTTPSPACVSSWRRF